MDKYEYYKIIREHLDNALSKLNNNDFDWLLDHIEEDIKDFQDRY